VNNVVFPIYSKSIIAKGKYYNYSEFTFISTPPVKVMLSALPYTIPIYGISY